MKFIRLCLVGLVMLGLTACKQVTIQAPANNFVDDERPVLFQLVFTGGAPTDLAIQLNTTQVTDRFAVTATGAEAPGSELADVIYPGRNIFRVNANGKVAQIAFYYDVEGPKIHILDTDRTTMRVQGYAEDSAGVASLTLDGVAVTLDDKLYFDAAFADQPVNTFVATDNNGYSSETSFARKDQAFTGMSARLNQGGLDFLLAVLEQELGDADFKDILAGIKPVSISPFFGVNLTIKLTQFDLDRPDIDLDIRDDETIDTHIEINNLDIGIRVWGNVLLLPINTGGVAHLDKLVIDTDYLMDIVNSDLSVSLRNTAYNLSGLYVNLSIIPAYTAIDALISSIANSMINLFEPLITSVIDQIIMPIVSNFIKDIPINLKLVTLDDGETINVRAVPEFLDSADRGIVVDLNTRIWAPTPPAGIPGAPGSLFVEGETPSLGPVTPSGAPYDFGVSISSNVINQALFAAHEAGVTTMEIRPEIYPNATPEGIAVYSAVSNNIVEGDKLGMRIAPASAPFVKFMPGDDGAAGMLGWYDVSFYFDLYKPEWGEYRTLFGATFNLEVPFEISTTPDGYLSIGVEQLPTIFITKTDASAMLLLPPSFINASLDYFMPAVMPRLAEQLKVVPLPRIYNHSIFMEQFWVAGSGNNSLSLAGSLVPYNVTAAAPVPGTRVDYATANAKVTQDSVSANGAISSVTATVVNSEVTIDVDGVNPDPAKGNLEYRYRVDGGGWSVWKQREQIHLRRMLGGNHRVEVCARTPLLKQDSSCPVVQFATAVNR